SLPRRHHRRAPSPNDHRSGYIVMQSASGRTHRDNQKSQRSGNQRERIADEMPEQSAQNAGCAATDTFYAQARGPLANRSSGETGHYPEITDCDYQGQNNSNFLSSSACQARAAAHQTGNHYAEDQYQYEHNVINQQRAAAQSKWGAV